MTKLDNQIHVILQDEQRLYNNIFNEIKNVIEGNKHLVGIHELQKEVDALQQEEFCSLASFRKIIKVVSNLKYLFFKEESQLTNAEWTRYNNKLVDIDCSLHRLIVKSAQLLDQTQQEIIGNLEVWFCRIYCQVKRYRV